MRDAELLAAIVEDPADVAARQVYADVLLARGEPRGELIQVQLRREALADDDPDWPALRRRELALLAEHAARWRGDVPAEVELGFAGGFVDEVAGDVADVLPHLGALIAREPVSAVRLDRIEATHVEALAACQALHRIRSLRLATGSATPDPGAALVALVTSPILGALTSLDLGRAHLEVGIDALLASPLAQRLRTLGLRGVLVGDAGLPAILGAGLPRLEALRLETVDLHALGAARFVAALRLPALRSLSLNAAMLGDAEAAILADGLPALERLELQRFELGRGGGRRGIDALVEAPALTGLRHLDLRWNRLGVAGTRTLAFGFPALAHLDVRNCDVAVDELVAAPWARLRVLRIDARTDRHGRALEALTLADWPALRHLTVDGKLGAIGPVVELGAARLNALELRHADLTDASIEALTVVPWPALHTLSLAGNLGLHDASARRLASADLPALVHLDVQGTSIGKAGLLQLRRRFGAGVTPARA